MINWIDALAGPDTAIQAAQAVPIFPASMSGAATWVKAFDSKLVLLHVEDSFDICEENMLSKRDGFSSCNFKASMTERTRSTMW